MYKLGAKIINPNCFEVQNFELENETLLKWFWTQDPTLRIARASISTRCGIQSPILKNYTSKVAFLGDGSVAADLLSRLLYF